MRALRALFVLLVLGAVVTTVALAAANRSGDVSVAKGFDWDGSPVSGAAETAELANDACSAPATTCDSTLLHVTEPGQLTVSIAGVDSTGTGNDPSDIDLYLYASDASGKQGDPLKSSTGSTTDEQLTYGTLKAGYFLVIVAPASALNEAYKGKATLGPVPADPAPIDFGPDPTPSSGSGGSGGSGGTGGGGTTTGSQADLAPTTRVHRPRRGPVTLLSGTAADADGRVAYVDVALVRVAGKRCAALDARGRFVRTSCKAPAFIRAKGTKAWHVKLGRPLGPGSYRLYARATDDLGRVDAGFGRANSLRFSVK